MRILIADDHTLFRDTLTVFLKRMNKGYIVELADDLNHAYDLMAASKGKGYDFVILDLCMPGMNGFEGLKRFKETWPKIPVAIISGVAQTWEVNQSIDYGAAGFFPKSMSGQSLVHAIELVMSGEKFVPIEYIAPPVHNPLPPGTHPQYGLSDRPQHHYQLTQRENDVLKFLIRGASNQEIADSLSLQIVTIKLHVRSICRKLGAKNRTQAALFARENNLVKP